MYLGKVGNPGGFKWHFFLYDLDNFVKDNYRIYYDDMRNEYFLENKTKFKNSTDYFIVMRTSKRCYRVMYFNKSDKTFDYMSFSNSTACAEMIYFYACKYNKTAKSGKE